MNTKRKYLLAGAIVCAFPPAQAMDLHLPFGASLATETVEEFASYALPISGWKKGRFESIWAEGSFTQQAWRVSASDKTTLQLLAPLREQLIEAGYDVIFECDAASCGGFDFRFETEILPEPNMHIDLGDFRFLSAQRMGEDKPEYTSLVVSKSSTTGYIQVTNLGRVDTQPTPLTTSTKGVQIPGALDPGSLSYTLENKGSFVLDDLEFATGSSALSGEDFATVAALADYLNNNPERKTALVGHTDSEGSLSGNVALSKKRAASVVKLLTGKHGVSKTQVTAEGMGFLSPRASNLTEEGRTFNRRVEVILTSTQ
ncbi:OmpA family protein [Falsihalocynthiibacter sp. CO-5D18]